nr:hypothetical protein B0A51_03577 [Rachicladosporium sp. CCFEE 5018]
MDQLKGEVSAPLSNPTIYHGGRWRTVFVGTGRVATIVFFVFSCIMLPSYYYSPDISNWWIPARLLGAAAPMTIAAFASAPYVANIRLVLPPSLLKASPDAIRRWAARAPSDTRLLVQTYRWVPWPHHQGVWLSDLRRLPASKSTLANLEYVPMGTKDAIEKARAARGGALAMRMYGQLQVNRNVKVDKSQMPGVWDALWERIPMKAEIRTDMASSPAVEKPRIIPRTMSRNAAPKRRPPPPPRPGRTTEP